MLLYLFLCISNIVLTGLIIWVLGCINKTISVLEQNVHWMDQRVWGIREQMVNSNEKLALLLAKNEKA